MEFLREVERDAPVVVGTMPPTMPGATGDDQVLWRELLALGWPRPVGAAFNVRVGPAVAALRVPGDDAQALEAQLLALRLDALLYDGADWWLVELHRSAGLPQLGRLVCYPELLVRTYPAAPRVTPLMVAAVVNPFTLDCFLSRGIPVLELAAPPSVPRLHGVGLLAAPTQLRVPRALWGAGAGTR